LTDQVWTGVWLSDVPLDENEGAHGDTLLLVKIPKGVIAEYEWIEEGKPYREFLAPASLVNRYGPAIVVDAERELFCGSAGINPEERVDLWTAWARPVL